MGQGEGEDYWGVRNNGLVDRGYVVEEGYAVIVSVTEMKINKRGGGGCGGG